MRRLIYGIPLLLALALMLVSQSSGPPIGFTPVGTSPAGNGCSNTSVALLTPTGVIYTCQSGVYAVSTATPSGTAGGDLSGTYPNPTVAKIGGVGVTGPAVTSTLHGTVVVTTPASDVLCAKAGDTSNGLTCNNSLTDDTTAFQYFATTYTIPAGLWAQGRILQVCALFNSYSTATTPAISDTLAYGVSNTALWTTTGNPSLHGTDAPRNYPACWQVVASSTTNVFTLASLPLPATTAPNASGSNSTAGPVAIGASSQSLQIGWQWATNTGIKSGTYTSGGSISGSATQTCSLSSFNNNTNTTGTVALTGSNTIAGGTSLVITNTGYGGTGAATTATLGNGTATCSGTATISTVQGGAQGNQIVLQYLAVSILN